MLHKTVTVKLLHLLKYAMIHHHQKNQSCKIAIRQAISFISLNLQYNHQLKCSYSILCSFIPMIIGNQRKLVAFQMFSGSIETVHWVKIV